MEKIDQAKDQGKYTKKTGRKWDINKMKNN